MSLERRILDMLKGCVGKKKYPTSQVAQKVADGRRVKLRVYFCDKCQDYHLTSKI